MEKAYDRLEQDFIKKCLKDLGFFGRRINKIMQCITVTSLYVIVSGRT